MEGGIPKLGSSLPVPSVQELVKQQISQVPARYVRPNLNLETSFIANGGSSSQIPVIDMAKLTSPDLVDSQELQNLHEACKQWGFFQLINHGVSSSVVERMKKEAKGFFKLPLEEKNKYSIPAGDLEGYGQNFVKSEEQKLDWADMFYVVTLPTYLRKPYLFPNLPLPLREAIEAYSLELRDLALKLLDFMVKAMKMDPNDMKVLFEEGKQMLRINCYPPCPQPDQVIGLTPHSDLVGITIVLVVDEMEGLQIKKDGKWLPVKPIQNAFVVNIGDSLEVITNGIYKSIEHRAVVNSRKERLSIATFYGPKLDGELGPAPSLITPQTPALYKRIKVTEFWKGFFGRELNGKSYIGEMKLTKEEIIN